MTATDRFNDQQCYTHMQARVFNDDCNHHATDKHHRGVVHVASASVTGAHYTHQWIEYDGDQTCDR